APDMRGVSALQQKGAGTHCRQPVLGEPRCLQEAARPLDARQPRHHPVGDAERRLEAAGIAHDATMIPSGTRTRPVSRSVMRPDLRRQNFASILDSAKSSISEPAKTSK